METISIFIAGAKKLKEQRLCLKALTNDLNSRYCQLKKDVSIHMNSYENFGEKQSEYNDFILNQADLVIFVLEERIGPKTEEEYLLATKAYKEKGHPTVLVFLHSHEGTTPEIDHIEKLINRTSETYYIEYANTDELIAKAKDRIYSFIEKDHKQSRWWSTWRKRLLFTSIAVLASILCFFSLVFFDNTNYLSIISPDPPVSLINSGMNKEFIHQQIIEGVKEAGENAQSKLESIINELIIESEKEVPTEDIKGREIIFDSDFSKIGKPTINNYYLQHIRTTLGKHDVNASVRIVESDSSYISRIVFDTWKGLHNIKTIEEKKSQYANNQRCALNLIKKSAAFIATAYSPIASVLYDYHTPEGLEEYQMSNPWKDDLFSQTEREMILLENSPKDSKESIYSKLLLANYYEKSSIEKYNPNWAQKACTYYRQFLDNNKLYQSAIQSKIESLTWGIDQVNHIKRDNNLSIPEFLMQNGTILPDSNCKQLIIVSNEEILYENGKSYYKASLYSYEMKEGHWQEVFPVFKVNLGIKGLAFVNQKVEGDLKTPSGFFPIPFVFGYKKDIETKMDFVEVEMNHVWVCDTSSNDYNKLILDENGIYKNNTINERMYRPDHLNKYAIVIGYNMSPIVKGKGSAIFMHVERTPNHKTAGCISMSEKNIKKLINWLNPKYNPHIYISKQLDI